MQPISTCESRGDMPISISIDYCYCLFSKEITYHGHKWRVAMVNFWRWCRPTVHVPFIVCQERVRVNNTRVDIIWVWMYSYIERYSFWTCYKYRPDNIIFARVSTSRGWSQVSTSSGWSLRRGSQKVSFIINLKVWIRGICVIIV